MYRSLIFLLAFHQAFACLDLLVRSFNEVFSPMIETGDGRIRKPHRVDDLTDYYKIDDLGNIIPNTELVSSLHFSTNHEKSAPEDEETLLQAKNPKSMDEHRNSIISSSGDQDSNSLSNTNNAQDQIQDDIVSSPPILGYGVRKYKYRGAYEPGKRPLIDLFIKLIETFQLTANAKFITSRPRYGNGQLEYE